MTYTPFLLAVLGFVGILLHNLIKLDSINRANDGHLNLGKYIRLEKITIVISVIVIGVSAWILDKEIHYYLEERGFVKYFGIGFIFLGYFAQSVLVKLTNIVQKKIDKDA